MMNNSEKYLKAKKRAESKVGFYIHLAIYLVISIMLVFINYTTSTEYFWYKWPIMGWGLAVVVHGLNVFFLSGGNTTMMDKMIDKEMKKES